jgi:transcriptional regulator with XRE-family HTH domain
MTSSKTVSILAEELGERLSAYRLSRNLRQKDIADQSGISRGAVARIEAGKGGTIDSLLRIMQALDIEERIEMLLPDTSLSPLDARNEDTPRQRARITATDKEPKEPWSWGE